MFRTIVGILFLVTTAAISLPSDCSSKTEKYYDYVVFECQACPSNTNKSNTVQGLCTCTPGFTKNRMAIGFLDTDTCTSTASNRTVVMVENRTGGTTGTGSVVCSIYSNPSTDYDSCVACPRGMTTDLSGGCICNATQPTTPNSKVKIGTTCSNPANPSTSGFEYQRYAQNVAITGCQANNDEESCQMLLNMCASQQYSGTFSTICSRLSNQPYFPTNYKIDTINIDELGIYVSTQQNINTTEFVNKLSFMIATYDRNGVQMSFKHLEKELFLCDATLGDSAKFQSFGNNMYKSCTVTISPNDVYFYELFIKTANGKYAIVPITYTGSAPYYRRFTLGFDYTTNTSLTKYTSVSLFFTYKPPLLTPYLVLSTKNNPAEIKNNSAASSSAINALIPFIIMEVIILIWCGYQAYKYLAYNPHEQIELNYCPRIVWNIMWISIRCFAVGNWIFLTIGSLVCFCFYKFQKTLFFTLADPGDSNAFTTFYQPFETLFYITFAFSIVGCLELVWRITKSEYFLIDWEKPGQVNTKFPINQEINKNKVSIWRKLFVVNELYELSISRLYNLEFTLLLVGLFLQGLGWINLRLMVPSTSISDTQGTKNSVLGYFLITFLYSVIAAAQIFFRRLLRVWFPLPVQEFVDLCCISNISIFIFDQALHGYYIHGRNPIGKAEGSLEFIESIFEKESQNKGRGRGLDETDSEAIQTFEMVISRIMRYEFNKIYMERMKGMLTTGQVMNAIIPKAVPELDITEYDAVEKHGRDMANTFRHYLDDIKKNRTQVRTRNCCADLWGCPPDEFFYQNLPVLFRDSQFRFTKAFLCGNQWYLLTCEITVLNFWFMILQNTYQAIFLTWIIVKLFLKVYHEYFMKRNLSANTLVDQKFFV